MRSKTPYLDEFRQQLWQVTQENLAYAAANSAPLGDNEVLLELALGHTLENLHEAARAHVLMGHLAQQHEELIEGRVTLPKEIDEEDWLQILEIKMAMCEHLCTMYIFCLAMEEGVSIPDNCTTSVIFHEGQFQATALPRDGSGSGEDEKEAVFTPEEPEKHTVH